VELDLRSYVQIIRRHRWIVLECTVVVAAVAIVLTLLKTPTYTATARVLLRPNDPSEQLTSNQQPPQVDPQRYASAQVDIIHSHAVADAVAKRLKTSDPDSLLAHLSVAQSAQNDILSVSVHDPDPVRARDVANNFALAYIDDRKQFQVANLQQAADQIQAKLQDLQNRIAQLDSAIGDGGGSTGTASIAQPAPAASTNVGSPQQQVPAPDTGDQAVPTNKQTLLAARYAASIQYENLFSQQQQILVDISLKRGGAELIEDATTPTAPSSPGPLRNGILGLLAGLVMGLVVAFLREQLDDKIRSREDVEAQAGLPVIAEPPLEPESTRRVDRIAAAEAIESPFSEAVRALRTSIQFLAVEHPIRRLLITSPGPGDGKSLVSANLATVCAQAGMTTVLVSADIRRPRIEEIFGIDRRVQGLTDLIIELAQGERSDLASKGTGMTSPVNQGPRRNGFGDGGPSMHSTILAVSNYLLPTQTPGLSLLPAGFPSPNPAEVLGSQQARDVLEALGEIADIVIIDTPPVVVVTDASVLANAVDGVAVVAALGETARDSVKRATSVLASSRTRLLGVIFNKVEASRNYYGYYGTDGSRTTPPASPVSKRRRRAQRVAG
jgi:polysaccharide biosynthesis transport protein